MKSYAEAPGKIILVGEHFVVWGSTALAAAIDKKAVAITELADEDEVISEDYGTRSKIAHNIVKGLYPIAKAIYATKEQIGSKKQVKITLRSDIPHSSGLGSSSAVAVATVASVANALGASLSTKEIFDLAMVSEKIVHGTPSGIDVAVAAYGGILLYKKGEVPKQVDVDGKLDVVIAISGLSRKTASMISRVAQVREKSPKFFSSLVSSSAYLSALSAQSLGQGNSDDLSASMIFHNAALSWLGVSTPATDKMIEISLENGALAAKITGGGGGGAVIALAKQGKTDNIVRALRDKEFDAFAVRLPQQGVKIWKEE